MVFFSVDSLSHIIFTLMEKVHDGWSSSGKVLYDESRISSTQARTIMYSISNKMMVRFKPQPRTNNTVFYWDVFSVINNCPA